MARRPPPELTEEWLLEQARRYLERYWPSAMQLRRVLLRRVDRAIAHHGGERADGVVMVERILHDLKSRGVLDDARFARAWVEELQRKGYARAVMRGKLFKKGVSAEIIDTAVAALDELPGDPQLAAACRYARRRRLGPLRQPEEKRRERRDRDVASMRRAGFSYGLAVRVIDTEDLDALEVEAAGYETDR